MTGQTSMLSIPEIEETTLINQIQTKHTCGKLYWQLFLINGSLLAKQINKNVASLGYFMSWMFLFFMISGLCFYPEALGV